MKLSRRLIALSCAAVLGGGDVLAEVRDRPAPWALIVAVAPADSGRPLRWFRLPGADACAAAIAELVDRGVDPARLACIPMPEADR